ncbi:MAG: biopolymer transporter ExbD [Chitinophagales bacterium]|nr:biopolymer transporter ExbD [Chitinophagales bacterium]
MAELNSEASAVSRKQRSKRMSTKIDFTPMVDLGFLLITFFMLATSWSKPYVLDIAQPVDGSPTPLSDSLAMSILLSGQNKVYYYFGFAESGIHATDFSPKGLRKLLLEKNASQIEKINRMEALHASGKIKEAEFDKRVSEVKKDRNSLMVIIKSDEHAKYSNLVDLIDELYSTNVSRYAMQDITREELDYIATQN